MDQSQINLQSLELHKKLRGKLEIKSKVSLNTRQDLNLAYTPGVAAVSLVIADNKNDLRTYTNVGNTVAVITDGSAVLGLGNIGPEAAMPVMEGKAILFKEFAGVDAIPICLLTQDVEEIIQTIKNISPSFAGINLEDISAPRCFEIEERLQQELSIPVFHDDQHGTAIVVLAGLINALKVVNKNINEVTVVITGAGAAGSAITTLLYQAGVKKYRLVDSKGLICHHRTDLNDSKLKLIEKCQTEDSLCQGDHAILTLEQVISGADVVVGVSGPNTITSDMIKTMNSGSIVFALANPTPEIMPEEAVAGGAAVVATGRSDFPNQINNVLVFPGIFRGLLDAKATIVTPEIKIKVAEAIAAYVENPTFDNIIPSPLDKNVAKIVAQAVINNI
ncbi:MAG TPA: NADP-dependent malic enzyme [Candidatus Paceibacterota bacterium]